MTFIRKYWISLLVLCGLYACSATKYVPDGEYLLDKVKINSDVSGYGQFELNQFIRQQPNLKMFALNKTMFQLYNLSGRDSLKWHNRFLKKIGEEPVIFDSTLVLKTNSELTKFFVNKGYINVDVSSEIIRKGKKAEVTYTVKGNDPYRIGVFSADIGGKNITFDIGDKNKPLSQVSGEHVSIRSSLIKYNMLFDRNILDLERDRITRILRNRGYYSFNKEFISYEADSTLNSHTVDLNLKLDYPSNTAQTKTEGSVPLHKYYYDKVKIYLDYDPLKLNGFNDYEPSDSLQINDYTIYYKGKQPSIKPRTLIFHSFIEPATTYSQLHEDATYFNYSSLSALNNVHIHFDEFTRNDSSLLVANILTMPARQQSVTYSVEGTNTAGNLGVASGVSYSHRNIFRGSETFNFKVRGAYETISNFEYPYLEMGGEASIHIPKLYFPFLKYSFLSHIMRTSTEFSLSYNQQNRPEYSRTLFSGGIHYTFQGRKRTAGRHQLNLLDIDYVYLPKKDSLFMSRLPSGAQYFGYTDQFIVGMGYSFTKTTFDPMQKQRNAYSFRLQFESAGNAMYGLNKAFQVEKGANQVSYQLFNTYFAQFVKGDVDYAKTIVFDRQNSLAWRIGGGIGFPYGNSEMLPFEKRYYSGGANSVRAWTVRELGPGNYQPGDSTTFFNQSGDIKLDLNLEYRTRFFWKLEAAAFIDAGNIWTIKNYTGQEGGRFKFDEFYKQIALGYGLGLRLDMNFFLVRFDCGWKVYDPALRGKDVWTVLHPNRSDNWAWHIAVGYPF
ncbi:MAG: outer membrane protein assembly factor [Dysgonamonadaceae bacterium]|jgi:hypothetical protein|nr:outer membrane protein assembly factor [Dysgonamonadaceae bacterium]